MIILITVSLFLLALWVDVKVFDLAVDERGADAPPAPSWAYLPFGGFIYRDHIIDAKNQTTTVGTINV